MSLTLFAFDLRAESKKILPSERAAGLLRAASAAQLADTRYWRLLLAYDDLDGPGGQSMARAPAFFLAPNGNVNPTAELRATILAAFDEKLPRGADHPICRFPARYRWIESQVAPEHSEWLPKVACKSYEIFRTRTEARAASLVFASYHPHLPSSLFGHTFIRLRQGSGHGERDDLDDFVINFSAAVPDVNLAYYLYGGLAGEFVAIYEVFTYADQVYEYNQVENRDLWEFDLTLTSEEIRAMTDFVWDMRSAEFRYYYFTENCSFQILRLLEAARPRVRLSDEFDSVVHPADTVREAMQVEGLIERIVYRPSVITRYRRHYALLTPDEREALDLLVEGGEPDLEAPGLRPRLIYAVALEYALLKRAAAPPHARENYAGVLNSYAALIGDHTLLNQIPGYVPDPGAGNPVFGHAPAMIALGGGGSSVGPFAEYSIRPALRELHDAFPGYSVYSELDFFRLTARSYTASGTPAAVLHDLRVVHILSLAPMGARIYEPSWLLSGGVHSLYTEVIDNRRSNAYAADFRAGMGATMEAFHVHTWPVLLAYGFAIADVEGSSHFAQGFRAGPGALVGVVLRFSHFVSLDLSGEYTWARGGDVGEKRKANGTLNIYLADSLALLVQAGAYQWDPASREQRLTDLWRGEFIEDRRDGATFTEGSLTLRYYF